MRKNVAYRFLLLIVCIVGWRPFVAQPYSQEEQRYVDSLKALINNERAHDTLRLAARYEYGESTMQLRVGYWDSLAVTCLTLLDELPGQVQKTVRIYLAESYNNVGYVYMNQGDAHQAIRYYQKSLDARKPGDSKSGTANTLNNLGMVYFNQGDVSKSLEHIHQALKMREAIGDQSGIAYSLNNLGYIYDNQGEPEKALNYYFKALAIQEEIQDKRGMALSYNNIGSIYQFQKNTEKALENYQKGIGLFREIGDKNGEALALNNIGAVYKENQETKQALDYYNRSLALREEIDDKQGMSYSLHNIGRTYFYAGFYSEAQRYAVRALGIAREIGYPENIRDAALLLAEVYEKQGKGMDALHMQQLYMQMKDSINNEATQRATLKQQARYEYEKQKTIDDAAHEKQLAVAFEQEQKQQVIIYAVIGGLLLVLLFSVLIYKRLQLTRRQKQIIEEQKQQVEQANEELEIEKQNIELKALKAQINPHFIFNALNSVQKHIIDNNKEQAHDYLAKFGKIMRSTLENSEMKAIPIKEELELLTTYVELESKRVKNGIEFHIELDEQIDEYNSTIPPMLIQPFIENAIRHGISNLEQKGEIRLTLKQEDDKLTCIVIDNGIGREASMKRKQQSVQAQHRSMGMEITRNRLRNLWKKHGEQHDIEIEDLWDRNGNSLGTTVKITLPLDF
ncbi:MAG: tetratricopeptide repeat protein [Flavobacteriales bacterium]|nr:tetratricopeptide repeat protein [Flavobacteriales bacterium]